MTPAPRLDGAVKPEAACDKLPEGVKPLAAVLQELAGILPGLKAALERNPPVERLTYRIDEVADALGMSRRAIEREGVLVAFLHLTCSSGSARSGDRKLCAIGSTPGRGETDDTAP